MVWRKYAILLPDELVRVYAPTTATPQLLLHVLKIRGMKLSFGGKDIDVDRTMDSLGIDSTMLLEAAASAQSPRTPSTEDLTLIAKIRGRLAGVERYRRK